MKVITELLILLITSYSAPVFSSKSVNTEFELASERNSKKENSLSQEYIKLQKAVQLKKYEEILILTLLLLEKDPSSYAVEVIYPLYSKQKNRFEKVMSKFKLKQQKFFKKSIDIYEDEIKNGNG